MEFIEKKIKWKNKVHCLLLNFNSFRCGFLYFKEINFMKEVLNKWQLKKNLLYLIYEFNYCWITCLAPFAFPQNTVTWHHCYKK